MSSNEIEKAASLREKYWLYFLPNISGGKSSEPLMIRDPYKNVLRSRKYSIKGVKFEITERSRRTKATSERPRMGI